MNVRSKYRLIAAHEEPAAATIQITGPDGQAIAGNAGGPPVQAARVAAHASASLATLADQRLTGYVAGYPGYAGLQQLMDFIAPPVPVARKFSFVTDALNNAFAVTDDDRVGPGGLPAVVRLDPKTVTEKTAVMRGLETPFPYDEQNAAAAELGNSVEAEANRRARFLANSIQRGIFTRLLAVMNAAKGEATSVSFASGTDPINALETHLQTVADACGDRAQVRVLFGSTAWATLRQHAKLTGSGVAARKAVTLADIAAQLELPAENVRVSYHLATTSKEGVTNTKSQLLGGTQIWVFAARNGVTEDDPSAFKRFYVPLGGQQMMAYRYQPHPLSEMHLIATHPPRAGGRGASRTRPL